MRGRFLHGARRPARLAAWVGNLAMLLAAAPAMAAQASASIAITKNQGIVEIISHADPVVKGVMGVLVLASVATWALWFVKTHELSRAKDCLRKDIKTMTGLRTLEAARAANYSVTLEMVEVASAELRLAGPHPSHRQLEGAQERVSAQLPMVEARAMHRILWGTNILASIGSISPFVGLAGTVWGILHSFMGIAQSKSTSLAVVAPGIAEALLATAIGLAAAIPAVLIYNSLTRAIAGYRRLLNEVAVLAACVLSRESESLEAKEAAAVALRPRAAPARLEPVSHSTEGR